MRRWLRKVLYRPVLWATRKYSSKPDKARIFQALTDLHSSIIALDEKKGLILKFDSVADRFVILSDQHKGIRDGADDFMLCELNFLAALDHYYENKFLYIALGDCEELWENTLMSVKKAQTKTFESEKRFVLENRFIKIFGNHDLYWQNDPLAGMQLKEIYSVDVPIYEGVLLQTMVQNQAVNIFCTHGHQGDLVSDGNWLSKFFVSKIWGPLQSFLRINPNTPAYDAQLKTLHNSLMYQWSAAQENLVLITGHTHQPVFESLTHIERLYRQLLWARKEKNEQSVLGIQKEIQVRKFEYDKVSPDYLLLKPNYFNSGCCCFNDGDITGIEIEAGCIRLIKWHSKEGTPVREVLEEAELGELIEKQKQKQ